MTDEYQQIQHRGLRRSHSLKRGVRAKFEQNKDILQVLLDTQDNVLAECSLMDKKWGIGVAIDNPDCSDPSKWNGKNYLGRILMEVRDELRRLSVAGRIGYVDAKDLQFPLWNSFAGVLRCNPKLYPVINAYCDTLPRQDIQSCFLYDYSLYQWEIAMHTNMGGGLPAIGFWEMKQDIYETLRVASLGRRHNPMAPVLLCSLCTHFSRKCTQFPATV